MLCQYFVYVLICPDYARFPYDILLLYSNGRELQRIYEGVMTCSLVAGLQVVTEKIQILLSYEYLSYVLEFTRAYPQKIFT